MASPSIRQGDSSNNTGDVATSPVRDQAEPLKRVSFAEDVANGVATGTETVEEVALDDALDEETRLSRLVTARDQDDLERDIGRQADKLLLEQANERDNKRLEKTQVNKQRLVNQLRQQERRLAQPANSNVKNRIRAEIANTKEQIQTLDTELEQIQQRIEDRHKDEAEGGDTLLEEAGQKRLPNESRRDFLIRTGKITPFSRMPGLPTASSNLADVMLDAEVEDGGLEEIEDEAGLLAAGPKSHRNLTMPGFQDEEVSETASVEGDVSDRPRKRRRLQTRHRDGSPASASDGEESEDAYLPELDDRQLAAIGESNEEAGEGDASGDFTLDTPAPRKRKAAGQKARKAVSGEAEQEDFAGLDDGNEQVYQARLRSWIQRRSDARRKAKAKQNVGEEHFADAERSDDDRAAEAEWYQPHPTKADTEFEDGFRIPGDIYPSLFDYQKTGVQWLSELYSQQTGGIIGDEMGLGKTIQVISFLAGLHYSKKLTKPIIVVAPATIMKNWVNEFHRWWPPFRVSILHTSGSGMMDVRREERMEDELEADVYSSRSSRMTKGQKSAKRIVDRVVRDGHVLVTTYSGLQSYAEQLLGIEWEYAVLDEGHKIRNPNAGITIFCKQLRTPNRVILSGTPMQNNLTELWSLFDFVFPMRLGTLVNFRNQFEFPIKQGGYANASNLQVETAMKCAETLKETISAYLLQRFKVDVAADLPRKSERVLFCKLTKLQRDGYQTFLGGEEMQSIMDGKRQALFGIDILRKICNHPDLVEHKTLSKKPGYHYGSGAKSGKMQVVKALLEIWKKGGHKTLLFAQHRIMLDILEIFVKSLGGFNYRRMDGNTSIKDRQGMVDEFNNNPDIHVFLLTTKVGGLGVNLTGADRVIIYDPDWNPSTDVQARERAWRLGQKREVEIYRLMTAGTIEEKIYHRQIFKQFLTNKILRDPKQRQTFQLKDLHDLFTLGDATADGQTETGTLFKGTEVNFSDKQRDSQGKGITTPPTQNEASSATTQQRLNAITGVSRQEDFRSAADETTNAQDTGDGSDIDPNHAEKSDRLLSTIFARSGVQSALEHDAILGSNSRKPKIEADPAEITREARRVAAQAARELQRAGEIARTIPAGVPTWTGLVGEAGRLEEPRPRPFPTNSRGGFSGRGRGGSRGGGGMPSSASVLANLSARQPGVGGTGTGTPSSSRSSTPQGQQQPKGREFLVLIRDFLLAHGGQVHTQMLIDHFNRFCGTPQRTAEFKEMLRQIAVLEKGGRGRAKWVLKDEFRKKSVGG